MPIASSGLAEVLSSLQHKQQEQQQQQQQGQFAQPSNVAHLPSSRGASLRQLAADWARSPSMADLPPGFGPMSLTPSAAAAGLADAIGGSLTDAEFGAILAGDEDVGDLDELLMKHASWVFDTE
jgi:hypothetical protein